MRNLLLILLVLFVIGCDEAESTVSADPNVAVYGNADAIIDAGHLMFDPNFIILFYESPPREVYVYDPNSDDYQIDSVMCYLEDDRELILKLTPDGNISLRGGSPTDFIRCYCEGYMINGKIFTGEVIVEEE